MQQIQFQFELSLAQLSSSLLFPMIVSEPDFGNRNSLPFRLSLGVPWDVKLQIVKKNTLKALRYLSFFDIQILDGW